MISLPNVQLLCVHGSAPDPNNAVAAMRVCMSQATFGGATFIAENPGRNMMGVSPIAYHRIRGDLRWYNQFMVSGVLNFLTHDFVLVVQHDGFIVNPEAWTDEFLQYDYVGAPWPVPRPQLCRVGNGGFSLRSRKLQEELSKMSVMCHENEDAFICDTHRAHLESCGIRFAPPDLAAQFAIEFDTWHHEDYGKVPFGIHNWYDDRIKYMELRNRFR